MKCTSAGIEWKYDSCERDMDPKENDNPDINKLWQSLKHICPQCGNLRKE